LLLWGKLSFAYSYSDITSDSIVKYRFASSPVKYYSELLQLNYSNNTFEFCIRSQFASTNIEGEFVIKNDTLILNSIDLDKFIVKESYDSKLAKNKYRFEVSSENIWREHHFLCMVLGNRDTLIKEVNMKFPPNRKSYKAKTKIAVSTFWIDYSSNGLAFVPLISNVYQVKNKQSNVFTIFFEPYPKFVNEPLHFINGVLYRYSTRNKRLVAFEQL